MSLDVSLFLTQILSLAGSLFNAMIPVIALLLGITIGVGLAFLIYKYIDRLFNIPVAGE
jgi:hypothetical protein